MNDFLFTNAYHRALSTWTLDTLEAVRVIAQAHAYRVGESRQDRVEWAKLSLRVNDRLPGSGQWQQARRAAQNFWLRTWIIDNLGPDPADTDWDPDALAADTIAALSLDPDAARDVAQHWRRLPVDRIGELRRHRNMTGHLPTLIHHVEPGPIRDTLLRWIEVRRYLP